MSVWPVGLSTGCFYRTSIFEILEKVRDSGFSMIEVCSFPDHLDYRNVGAVKEVAGRMASLGLEGYSFHAPFHISIDITALEASERGLALEEIMRAADAAAVLGVQNFVIHPGPEKERRLPMEEYGRRIAHAAEALAELALYCGALGLKLVLENMLPHLLFGRSGDLLKLLGAMDRKRAGACLDAGHANIAGELASMVHHLGPRLTMVHVNDNNGREDEHKTPGEGTIDWRSFMRLLEAAGFRGALILELAGVKTGDLFRPLEKAREGRALLTRLMEARP
jgi:sugar phosphate isomerase/epimerase